MKITARAPATVANVIVGFDSLALAIEGLYDDVTLIPNDLNSFRIISIENGGRIPKDPLKNVCTIALETMREAVNGPGGFDIAIKKGYQAGSGLGSSAASATAGLWAYNAQLGYPLSKQEIIPFAMKSEEAVSGKEIADNVAACALGGLVLIRSAEQYDFISLPTPKLFVGCALPNVSILTKEARSILPEKVSMETAVKHGANFAGFISSLYTNDFTAMKRSMQDVLVERYRSKFIPHFNKAKTIAIDGGAICFGIAGSGPAMFYFIENDEKGLKIINELKALYSRANMKIINSLGPINETGVHILQ